LARFRITFGRHRQRNTGDETGRTYTQGEELDLDRYDPKWQDKFEGREAKADQLKRTALVLNRKVWEKDLRAAAAEADAVERRRYFLKQRGEGREPTEIEVAQHVSADLRRQDGAELELTGGPMSVPETLPPPEKRGPGRPPNPRPQASA
jgi:hypothetical protein